MAEISSEFLQLAMNRIDYFSGVCGDLEEFIYNDNRSRVKKITIRKQSAKDNCCCFSGGTFLTRQSVVKKTGMFDTGLKVNEDVDYSLRLRKHSPFLYLPLPMGIHHTHSPDTINHTFSELKHLHPVYTGMLFRKHWNNKNIICLFTTWSELFFGVPLYLLLSFSLLFLSQYALIASVVIFSADMFYGVLNNKKTVRRVVLHYINPLIVLLGLFCQKKDPTYTYRILN